MGGQPNLRKMFQRRSRLTVSMPLSDQRRPSVILDVVHDIFLAVSGHQVLCQLCCIRAGARIEILARQDQPRAEEDG